MIDVIVFHHALGLTKGVTDVARQIEAAGHRVAVPDMYNGERFDTVDEGVEYAEMVGFDTFIDLGAGVAGSLDGPFATVGFSLGVLPAQHLAQTHSRARGAVLCHAAIGLGTFADTWPSGVALQLHNAERDPLGDYADAVELAQRVPGSRLHTYDTDAHLVVDPAADGYDEAIASVIVERTIGFLADL